MKYLIALLFATLLAACGQLEGDVLTIRTAAPNLTLHFRLLAPIDVVVPAEEVGEVLPDPTPVPPCDIVKGNISRDGRKLYHVEGMPNYNTVKIDEGAGEQFFCSVEEAEAAGWVRAGN